MVEDNAVVSDSVAAAVLDNPYLLEQILICLSMRELLRCVQVNRSWNHMIFKFSSRLHKKLFLLPHDTKIVVPCRMGLNECMTGCPARVLHPPQILDEKVKFRDCHITHPLLIDQDPAPLPTFGRAFLMQSRLKLLKHLVSCCTTASWRSMFISQPPLHSLAMTVKDPLCHATIRIAPKADSTGITWEDVMDKLPESILPHHDGHNVDSSDHRVVLWATHDKHLVYCRGRDGQAEYCRDCKGRITLTAEEI
ncbi:hypothetical protein KVT40_005054 [Elsinoe batatas]|uniref:F-box domain-containing protein n=1 Tax=Elsinoe batatas TaxID=2601811 RepID=A0A8K0PF81_9PEZI|nr:hypothetical protein KVT40_005054 [Elsinoe batatas]